MKRYVNFAQRFIGLVRRDGAYPLLKKSVGVFRREGLTGLRRRAGNRPIPGRDYAEWIEKFDTLDAEVIAAMKSEIAAMAEPPRISVVMPTYNADPVWLAEAIDSVRNQIYPHWELCIADDASTSPEVRPLLEQYIREDSRIRVAFREKNGHISAASNSALELVTSDWVGLLDHDDLLAPHALYFVAKEIIRRPDARLLYSDEDKIDPMGRRHDPYFKCDMNIDLFYSQNMISHFGVYQKRLLDEIGGFRTGLEGSQDHDVALRCLERIGAKSIVHIPRVLYHWRVHPSSTAASGDAKPYALIAGERALTEHFARQGIDASVEGLPFGYRVRYRLPEHRPLVSLIIPTRNGVGLLKQCIDSIQDKTTYAPYEIIVIDNGSDEQATLDYLESLKSADNIRVIRDDRPFNYSALNNMAIGSANGELVGLINNDIEVITDTWLEEMVSLALQPGVGAVGAKLLYPDGTIQHAGVVTGLGGVAGHAHRLFPRDAFGYFSRNAVISSFSAVTAACLIIRKSIYEQVGGLNEADLTVAFNDVDFCLRVRDAGYRNVWTPFAELYHHESATRGAEDNPEKVARFGREVEYMQTRWGDTLNSDPAYSPNLALDRTDFSLAWPPRIEPLPRHAAPLDNKEMA
ncbi:glycosyltransferase family 2 protein [Paraburkholderia phymatum]|uniref:Glycosyl transferase family 2 n=1 Tax=Paraburkholderia phymatum (strain DSM 17167 / CIP 108236 / LMG 21445 / STM815) TaxID=391038 RepID=B2JFA3_PARP8|nr:glycosyltransferase family 2 protein [Paraburkholderia phymatum]ACC71471.1 glycosyl transferase family 2 [Paraburkholderia phymatum STM815]